MIVSIFDYLYKHIFDLTLMISVSCFRFCPWCFTAEVLIRGEESHEIEARTDFMGLSADKDRIFPGDGAVIQGWKIPGLVNIQQAIENRRRNSGLTH